MNEENRDQHHEITIPVSIVEEEQALEESNSTIDQENVSTEPVNEYIDHLQRLQAEFYNYKKRIESERKSLYSIAKGELILKLLPVLDDFDRMISNCMPEEQCDLDGIKYIYQNLKKCLVNEGMEEIESMGKPFDPNIHEAVGVEETGSDREGLVVEEWNKGYKFGEKLLRPSQVKVGKVVY